MLSTATLRAYRFDKPSTLIIRFGLQTLPGTCRNSPAAKGFQSGKTLTDLCLQNIKILAESEPGQVIASVGDLNRARSGTGAERESHYLEASIHINHVAGYPTAQIAPEKYCGIRDLRRVSVPPQGSYCRNTFQNLAEILNSPRGRGFHRSR